MAHSRFRAGVIRALLAAAVGWLALPAAAQRKEETPQQLLGVGVTESLDAQIPLDLRFTDSGGKLVALGDLFAGKLPTILTMNYSNCPMLCSLQLNALVDAMRAMSWELGREYQVVTVSIDPLESPERARLTKQKYLKAYRRPGGEGWHFLTSRSDADIHKLADAVGFHYVYDPNTKQYAHAAVLMICTPQGRLSRYLSGVLYDPQTLRFSLLEAGQGKVGSSWDQVLLYCFHYDAESGRYGPSAFRLMQIGGLLTVVLLAGLLSVYWYREARKRKPLSAEAPS